MASFRELQKACRLQLDGPEMRVAVLGNCATQFFAQAVEGCGKLNAQLIDPSSETYAFRPDVILLWMCSEKLYEEFLDMPFGERAGFAETVMGRIGTCWERIAAHCGAKIIQVNFPEIDDKAAGQLSGKIEVSFIFQIRKLNVLLQEAAARNDRVFPADLAAIQNRMGRKAVFDTRMYYHAKMPLSMAALPAAAKAVVDILCSLRGKIRKCVILDLDNTLWGGVIGDDGMGGIEIGELGRGPVFSNLQRWLKQLKDFGIILAVCSKNEEAIAKEPFEQHPEMVMRMSDISVFVANWNDKASNIRLIRETLNIGMDSLVFLDDNPFERNLIREKLPEVTVPELPEDPAEWLDFLQEENLFDTVSFTGEHSDRTKLYQAEFARKQLEQTFESLDDYLESLAMTGCGAAFTPDRYPRIAQLTQRSNQFNLRTVRYTEDAVLYPAGPLRGPWAGVRGDPGGAARRDAVPGHLADELPGAEAGHGGIRREPHGPGGRGARIHAHRGGIYPDAEERDGEGPLRTDGLRPDRGEHLRPGRRRLYPPENHDQRGRST